MIAGGGDRIIGGRGERTAQGLGRGHGVPCAAGESGQVVQQSDGHGQNTRVTRLSPPASTRAPLRGSRNRVRSALATVSARARYRGSPVAKWASSNARPRAP